MIVMIVLMHMTMLMIVLVTMLCPPVTAAGVVHGRLHSRNVLICEGFRAKLVDFGISHLVSAACATGACVLWCAFVSWGVVCVILMS